MKERGREADKLVVGVTLINVKPGRERPIYKRLQGIGGIREIIHLFGEYDFLVIIEVEGLKTLNDIVDEIRDIAGITTTRTIIGAEL